MAEHESFETSEYGSEENIYEKYSAIHQIVQDKVREAPNLGCRVSISGNCVNLYFHCYEMHAPVRMKEIEATAKSTLDEMVKYLKKEYKARTSKALSLKELKEKANYTVQKVSLNERYHYVSWRSFELG